MKSSKLVQPQRYIKMKNWLKIDLIFVIHAIVSFWYINCRYGYLITIFFILLMSIIFLKWNANLEVFSAFFYTKLTLWHLFLMWTQSELRYFYFPTTSFFINFALMTLLHSAFNWINLCTSKVFFHFRKKINQYVCLKPIMNIYFNVKEDIFKVFTSVLSNY